MSGAGGAPEVTGSSVAEEVTKSSFVEFFEGISDTADFKPKVQSK